MLKDTRPIIVTAAVDETIIKPLPKEGRPANFNGAVGKYSIIAEASPQTVQVGDAIDLHFAVQGEGRLELLSAPKLNEQADLNRDFKVSDEPLAGIVDRGRKVFSTSIRPHRDDVTEIPPVEFPYFDPDLEQIRHGDLGRDSH